MTIDADKAKLCYAVTRQDPAKFLHENKEWVKGKEKYFDGWEFRVIKRLDSSDLFIVETKINKPFFKLLPSSFLCAAGLLESTGRRRFNETRRVWRDIKSLNLYFGKTKADEKFVELAKDGDNVFNVTAKHGEGFSDWTFKTNEALNLEDSSLVLPVADTVMNLGLIFLPEKKLFDGGKFLAGKFTTFGKALNTMEHAIEKTHMKTILKVHHGVELVEGIVEATEEAHHQSHHGKGTNIAAGSHETKNKQQQSGSHTKLHSEQSMNVDNSHSIDKAYEEVKKGNKCSVENIEKVAEEVKVEMQTLELSREKSEKSFDSFVDKVGKEKYSQLLEYYALRVAFKYLDNLIQSKDEQKPEQEYVKEGFEQRIKNMKQSMFYYSPLSLHFIHRAAQQSLSPYWNIHSRFRSLQRFMNDYKMMEQELANRLAKRKELLNDIDNQEKRLEAHDRAIHNYYTKLLKHREKLMSEMNLVHESLNFLGPLFDSQLPGAGVALNMTGDILLKGVGSRYQGGDLLLRNYQSALNVSEQNHQQLEQTRYAVKQQIGYISEGITQQRLMLLNASEQANPTEYFKALCDVQQEIAQEMVGDRGRISQIQQQMASNSEVAANLDAQADGLLTKKNAKNHKGRYQQGLQNRSEAEQLRASNNALQLELNSRRENLQAKKRLGEEYQEKIDQKKLSKGIDQFFYDLLEQEMNFQLGEDEQTGHIREASLKGFYNYRFAKDQRMYVTNQLLFSTESMFADLAALAAYWNFSNISKCGQKGQLLTSMGRTLYNMVDAYSTWLAGKQLINITLQELRKTKPQSTYDDAVKTLGPTTYMNLYLNPGMLLFSSGIAIIRQGCYLFGGIEENDVVSQLYTEIQKVSEQVRHEMGQIHQHIDFQHEQSKLLIKEISNEMEVLHHDIMSEIKQSKEEIVKKIDTNSINDFVRRINNISSKIKGKYQSLVSNTGTATTKEEQEKNINVAMNYIESQLQFIGLDSQRGLATVRSSDGCMKKEVTLPIEMGIRYPSLSSSILAIAANFSSDMPNVKLLNTISECVSSFKSLFSQDLSEGERLRINRIDEAIKDQKSRVSGLIGHLMEYSEYVFKKQTEIVSHWSSKIEPTNDLVKVIGNQLVDAAVKTVKEIYPISGSKRFEIGHLLQITPAFQPKQASWSEEFTQAAGVFGGSFVTGAGLAVLPKVLLYTSVVSVKTYVTYFTVLAAAPLAGIGVAVTAPVVYFGYKGVKALKDKVTGPTKEQIEILKGLTPATFVQQAHNLKFLAGKSIVKISIRLERDGKCFFQVGDLPKGDESTEKQPSIYEVVTSVSSEGNCQIDGVNTSLIAPDEAGKIDHAVFPDDFSLYDNSVKELVSKYISWLKTVGSKPAPTQKDNPFNQLFVDGCVVTSTDPNLLPLVIPRKLVDYCEQCLSYEKALIGMGNQGVLVPQYSFDRRGDKYILKLNFSLFHPKGTNQLEIQGLDILEVDAATVHSFDDGSFDENSQTNYLNECLIQLMYTSMAKTGSLGIPGADSVIFQRIQKVAPSELPFPGFYTLLLRKPHEKVIFDHRTYNKKMSQQVMDYIKLDDDEVENPLSKMRITASGGSQHHCFRRKLKEIANALNGDIETLQNNYTTLRALLCLVTSLSDKKIEFVLENFLGIIKPVNAEALLWLQHLNLIPKEMDENAQSLIEQMMIDDRSDDMIKLLNG